MRIRRGRPADAAAVLALFDEAVAWLVARGQTGQWGTEPTSANPKMVARVEGWAAGDGLWMAEDDGAVAGALVVGERPEHVHPVAEPELYVELLLSSRRLAGRRIGARLLEHAAALAREAGAALLRVDCWAGAPALVAFYERQGFVPGGTFDAGGWRGQVFSMRLGPAVVSVSRAPGHAFSKPPAASIRLLAGLGVEGDAHAGATVRHRSRVRKDPEVPNLRQVHLIHGELLDELRTAGFELAPGELGENVTTRGVDLLGLPTGTRLRLGPTASVEVTGLRNPCKQLDGLRPGLMQAVLGRDEAGNLVRKAGVMAIVLTGGEVRPGDGVRVGPPPGPHRPLETV